MGIVSKLFGDESAPARRQNASTSDYIDLSDYQGSEKTGEGAASTYIRFADLRQLDDLKQFSSYVYDGNMLILDFKAVQSDEILLRRLTNELRKIAADTGGDIAGLGDHHILLTPTGIKVDRRKMSVNKETGQAEQVQARPVAAPQPSPPMRTGPAPASAPAPSPSFAALAGNAGAPPARQNGTRGARMGQGR